MSVDPESAPRNFLHTDVHLKVGFLGNSSHDRTVNHRTCTMFLTSLINPIFIDEMTEVDLAKNIYNQEMVAPQIGKQKFRWAS